VLLNLYGASEIGGDSTFHEVGDTDATGAVTIGRPIDNTQIYILDGRRQPVPVGVPGEIYVAGQGLAKGYLNRPQTTAARFVANPFSGEPAARMYRTGDRARYRSDGTIDYLGRLDSQVKIRGFRIELNEVECALRAHPDVGQAVAIAREDKTGDRRLVGYIVPKHGVCQISDVFDFARRRLPGYMVPSALLLVEAFPLTPNGKVDRQALPAPAALRREVTESPRTPTEDTLAEMWAQLLGLHEVGVHDNFFDLGGHSLLAAQLVDRIEDAFRTTLPLRSLFEAPTVARLAALIEASSMAAPLGPLDEMGGRIEMEL
jgi:acyl-CoA synthetase (AMP-forming)/AMP-acid ligase II